MAVNGLLEAFPRTGSPDRAPGIDTRTYVATTFFAAFISEEGAALLNSNQRNVLITQAIVAAWALADAFLLAG
jgi:hypothetical protein